MPVLVVNLAWLDLSDLPLVSLCSLQSLLNSLDVWMLGRLRRALVLDWCRWLLGSRSCRWVGLLVVSSLLIEWLVRIYCLISGLMRSRSFIYCLCLLDLVSLLWLSIASVSWITYIALDLDDSIATPLQVSCISCITFQVCRLNILPLLSRLLPQSVQAVCVNVLATAVNSSCIVVFSIALNLVLIVIRSALTYSLLIHLVIAASLRLVCWNKRLVCLGCSIGRRLRCCLLLVLMQIRVLNRRWCLDCLLLLPYVLCCSLNNAGGLNRLNCHLIKRGTCRLVLL